VLKTESVWSNRAEALSAKEDKTAQHGGIYNPGQTHNCAQLHGQAISSSTETQHVLAFVYYWTKVRVLDDYPRASYSVSQTTQKESQAAYIHLENESSPRNKRSGHQEGNYDSYQAGRQHAADVEPLYREKLGLYSTT
jgi:hypothetical protein